MKDFDINLLQTSLSLSILHWGFLARHCFEILYLTKLGEKDNDFWNSNGFADITIQCGSRRVRWWPQSLRLIGHRLDIDRQHQILTEPCPATICFTKFNLTGKGWTIQHTRDVPGWINMWKNICLASSHPLFLGGSKNLSLKYNVLQKGQPTWLKTHWHCIVEQKVRNKLLNPILIFSHPFNPHMSHLIQCNPGRRVRTQISRGSPGKQGA